MLLGSLLSSVGDALSFAFGMTWEVLWALILGFWLSAIIQAVVSKEEMSRLMPGQLATNDSQQITFWRGTGSVG